MVKKAKRLREISESQAHCVRILAATTLILGLRRIVRTNPIPWSRAPDAARGLFLGAASLFQPAQPTMEPNFVRPTPPSLILYVAELLRLLIRQRGIGGPTVLPAAFKLRDDAARCIPELPGVDSSDVELPVELQQKECDQLVADFIGSLIDLNLSLPPDPREKHAPTTLANGAADEIVLGWDLSLDAMDGVDIIADSGRISGDGKHTTLPNEVIRLAAQTADCLRWNAALALYMLGADLAALMPEAYDRNYVLYSKRGEQARALLCLDVKGRARIKISASPTALAPS